MRTAIRKHLPDFLAIIGLLIIAIAVATVILGKQRLTLPAWVPLIGQDFFMVEAEMSTAQAITPGQGQTVNVAGVEVGEIASVKLRDGKAIIGMKIQPRHAPHLQGRVDPAAAQDRPEGHGRRAHARDPAGRPARGGIGDPGLADAARRQPRRDPGDARRRHARLPPAAAQRRRRRARLGGQGPASWHRRSGAWSRPRSTRARSTSSWPCGVRNLARVVHNFSLLTDELGQRDTQLANFVQNSNAVFDTLASQDVSLRADPAEAAGDAADDAGDARQGRHVRAGARADARVAAPGGARPRALAAPDAPVPARLDADHPRRDPPLHACGAADGAGAAPGDARPGGVTPDLTASFSVLNRLLNTIAYNPPGDREEGFLFWQSWVNHAGNAIFSTARRARADPARPGRAVVLERAAAGRGRASQPAAGHDHRAAQRALDGSRSARSRRRRPASGGTGG